MMWKLCYVWALCLVAVLFSTATGQGDDAVVLEASTCSDLREIFDNIRTEKRIIVTRNMRCTREKWPSPIFATNHTIIEGSEFADGVPSIDWADNTNALVVEEDASLTFQGIVLIQDFMQLGGLKLSFATGFDETSIHILGVGVGVRSCHQKLDSLIPVYEGIPRPHGIVGEQAIQMRSAKKIYVENVAFVPPRGDNATWIVCRSIFQCEVDSPFDKGFQRTLTRETLDPTCGSNTLQTLTENEAVQPSGGGDSSSSADGAVVGIITALCTALFLVGVYFAYKFWGAPLLEQQRNIKSRGIDEDNMPSEKFSDTTKSLKTGGTHHSSSIGLLNSAVQLTDIELGVPLGKGTIGTVYKGYVNNKPLAVKVVDVEASESFSQDDDPVGMYVAQHLYHVNVIDTLLYQTHRLEELSRPGAAGDASMMSGGSLYVDNTLSSINEIRPSEMFQYRTFHVMEFCNLGSLEQAMSGGVFRTADDEPKMLAILRTALDIAKGMCFLHQAKIIHGRLTPANILLKGDSMDSRGFVCKVSDFGLNSLHEKQQAMEITQGRNLSYRAPETLRKGAVENGSDVFAYGMILWSMLTGKLPFSGYDPAETVAAILEGARPDVPHTAPFKYERLIKDCWHADTTARPPFVNIIERLTKIVTDLVRGPTESISAAPKFRSQNLSNYASTDMDTVIMHGSGSISSDMIPRHRGHLPKSNYASTDMETVIIHGSVGSVATDLLSPKHRGHPRSNYASTDMETVVYYGSGSVCTERMFDSIEYQDTRGYLSPGSIGAGSGPFWEGYQSAGNSPISNKSDAASPAFDPSRQKSPRTKRYSTRLEKIDSDRIPEEEEEDIEEEEVRPERTNPGLVPSKPSETVSLRYGMASSIDSVDDIMCSNPSIAQQQ